MHDINDRVKGVRDLMKLSQVQFCQIIGIKQGTLSDIERKRINVSPKTIEKIYQNLHVSKDWLYTGSGDIFIDKNFIEKYGINVPDDVPFHLKIASAKMGTTIKETQNRENEQSNKKTDRNFFYKAILELAANHTELTNLHYNISDLAALLCDAEKIYETYLDTALNDEIEAKSYSDYKQKLIVHLQGYVKYEEIITPFILALRKFIFEFLDHDKNNVIEASKSELKS